MFTKKYRQRLEALFADIESLACRPSAQHDKIQSELAELRARLQALEEEIRQDEEHHGAEKKPAPIAPEPSFGTPLLYGKEQIGYAYIGEQVRPLQKASLPAIEPGRIVSLPLTTGEQVIGAIQIGAPPAQTLSSEQASLADAVAQQISLRIQNLLLLEAAERARAEAEAATRRFIHESWQNYLDGIREKECIGYAYDQAAVVPYVEPPPSKSGIRETVRVMDEQVGTLYVEPESGRSLTDEDKALVKSLADRIAHQIENIRLLADAARARAEAEEATRQLTREAWKEYMAKTETTALGFVYDSLQVRPVENPDAIPPVSLAQPLTVRGETVGWLGIAGLDKVPPHAADLAAAIAAQTSIHLETLRLTEELRKRAAELQELDRLKSAFLANMSHELRTPLNSILGFADVILEGLDGPLTENMTTDLKLIQKNGQHLLHLINDVLDMAKIEAGRMNLVVERFSLYEILEEVTSITSPLASEKNLALYLEPDLDKTVEVTADRTRLRQVMLNLVNNAIKFTEQGSIAISAQRQDDHVLIRVKDTGIGIAPHQIEAIFQEFVQVDTSTTRKAGGTGLGLPISRRLIEMHGGKLWAESTGVPGEGSTFYVLLPLEARISEPQDKTEK